MDGRSAFLYKSNMKHPSIQNYNLFGEAGDLPDVVHCETIETRSQMHDWEFTPHRHARLHQVLLIESGGGRAEIEGQSRTLEPGLFVNVPTGVVHGFSFLPGTHGWVMTLGAEVLDEILQKNEGLGQVLARPDIGVGSLEIKAAMNAIFAEFNTRRFARAHNLRMLSGHLLGLIARQIYEAGTAAVSAPQTGLSQRFEILLEQQFLNHWSVADYAQSLAVSPTHLSRVLRVTTGQSASKTVEARMVREARRLLVYTNLPVSQIAYSLGYIDPAYFSRFFAKSTGHAPRSFRQNLERTSPT